MKMPAFLSKIIKHSKEEEEYYLALEVKNRLVKAAVWNKIKDKSSLLGTAEKETTDNWDEVIKASDEAISGAAGNIPQDKINKTIFGLKESWITDGKIKKEILGDLKKLCSELTLTPLGFITNTESILSYLQKNEGTPLTAILIDIGGSEIALTIIRVGKINYTKIWQKGETSLSEEIAQVLKELPDKEILPSRILLYDGKTDLESVRQELISFPWTQKASFLHFPKVEIIQDGADLEGLVYAGSSELGSQLISTNDTPEEPVKTTEEEKIITPQSSPITPITPISLNPPTVTSASPDMFGFVEDKDILEVAPSTETPAPVVPASPPLSPASPIEPPKEEFIIKEPLVINKPPEPVINYTNIEEEEPAEEKAPAKSFTLPKINILTRLKEIFRNFPAKSILLVPVILLILTGGVIWAIGEYGKASISILVKPEIMENNADLTVSPDAKEINLQKSLIPASLLTLEEKGSKKGSTTGEKTVGEKAKGEITLYNKTTTGSKTFKSGTILIGPDEKEFTLDSDVTIPVASSKIEGITFGKATGVKITASDIGDSYNLSSGQKEFSVKEYPTSSYSGVTDTAFTGGSSRKIKIVAEDDLTALQTALEKELAKKAKTGFDDKLDKGQVLIAESIEKTGSTPKFSKEEGDEASEVSLEETVKYSAYAYNEEDIKKLLSEVVKKDAGEDYDLTSLQIDVNVEDIKQDEEKKGTLLLTIKYKTKLLPKLNKDEIAKNISGKNQEAVSNYIDTLPHVGGFEATVSPRLPKPFFVFPRNPKNITITITPQK